MNEFIEKIISINEPKTLLFLCGVFIFADVLTGYLKAFKNKKISWVIALILEFLIDYLVRVDIF